MFEHPYEGSKDPLAPGVLVMLNEPLVLGICCQSPRIFDFL